MAVVRQATILDAASIGRIEVETWRDTYAGMLPEKLLLGLSTRHRSRAWTQFLARFPADMLVATGARGAVIGFGNCGNQRGALEGFAGEVFTLYVAPEAQGQGVGRLLLLGLFKRLLRCELTSAAVWVLRDNPSRFFYERVAGRLVAERQIDIGGAEVDAVAYGWRDLAAVLKAQAGTGRSLG
jgi:ribosomal protein S18 acetylase RimI-like enzyme